LLHPHAEHEPVRQRAGLRQVHLFFAHALRRFGCELRSNINSYGKNALPRRLDDTDSPSSARTKSPSAGCGAIEDHLRRHQPRRRRQSTSLSQSSIMTARPENPVSSRRAGPVRAIVRLFGVDRTRAPDHAMHSRSDQTNGRKPSARLLRD
jgi:hypothetical protein